MSAKSVNALLGIALPDTTDTANVITGDCRKVLPRLAAASVDLVTFDSPYAIGQNYGDHYDDGLGEDALLALLEEALVACRRVLKSDGSLFVVMGENLQAEVRVLLKRLGFHRRRTIIWHE